MKKKERKGTKNCPLILNSEKFAKKGLALKLDKKIIRREGKLWFYDDKCYRTETLYVANIHPSFRGSIFKLYVRKVNNQKYLAYRFVGFFHLDKYHTNLSKKIKSLELEVEQLKKLLNESQ